MGLPRMCIVCAASAGRRSQTTAQKMRLDRLVCAVRSILWACAQSRGALWDRSLWVACTLGRDVCVRVVCVSAPEPEAEPASVDGYASRAAS